MSGVWDVYRCFDADDRLLYIGCSGDITTRMRTHRNGGRGVSRYLTRFMTRHELTGPFFNRSEALAAEAEAIATEQPIFNMVHRGEPTWQWRPRVARYLIDHGHLELALETACNCWRETVMAGSYDESCPAHVEAAALASTP